MTLTLLAYSVAQRQLRKAISQRDESIPNQINRPIKTLILRCIFQLLEGINQVFRAGEGKIQTGHTGGITELKKQLLSYFGPSVRIKYELNYLRHSRRLIGLRPQRASIAPKALISPA